MPKLPTRCTGRRPTGPASSGSAVFAATCIVLLWATSLRAAGPGPPTKASIQFNRDVRPILSENCYSCHGPDRNRRKAKLRLDERASALASKAIVPGKPGESAAVERIFSDDAELVMPPPSSHKALTASQKEALKAWIASGAEYQAHWAYVPPERPPVPSVRDRSRVRNPIDAFIQASLESKGIAPSPEADRRTLIRRLSLDLIGLPPTPEEVRDFERDTDPRAYEKVVDRLLRSPHYGERMAVPWLDMARFADTVGYHGDQGQRVFPYRDYVIDSFNRNKPFNVFTLEQLAGDLLPDQTPEQLVATCFNRLNMMTREGGAQPGEYLAKYAADRVRTVSITWLGSTMGCAECHDHKYDPFTQRDFYSLAAFFADLKQWGVYQDYDYTPNPELKGWSNDHPFPPEVVVESPYLRGRIARLRESIRKACADAMPRQEAEFERWLRAAAPFVEEHPTGWLTPRASVEKGTARVLDDGSLLLAAAAPAKEPLTIAMKPGPGRVARIRVEALPLASHKGMITRDGSESEKVNIRATVRGRSGEHRVEFFLAEAEAYEPRYFNGDEVPGVLDGWQTSKALKDRPQAAIWCLETPADLDADDELRVSLSTDHAGCVRLSISPFGFDAGGRNELDQGQRRAIADSAQGSARGPEVAELFGMSQGSRGPAWAALKALATGVLECDAGKAHCMVAQAAPPRTVRVLPRGNWQDESGPVVEPAVPHFLPGARAPAASPGGPRLSRLDLARWITSPENPLTARVFVNRVWKQLFGTGISAQVEDVGAQGEWPVHPELLDWLAVEFREGGWDVKRLVKLVVMSDAYRRESRARADLRDADPNNRLLACQSPRRLEAEFVRDNALAIAGLLNPDLGGPSVFPYQPAGYYANLQFPDREYVASPDDRQYRRGVYMHWQRTFLQPMLANFDAPSREECTATRNVANTPQQALTVLNDPTFVEAARAFAQGIIGGRPGEGSMSDADRINRIYSRALARPPRDRERESLLAFLAAQRAYFGSRPASAEELLGVGLAPRPKAIAPAELASWTAVCRVVLGLHETITRY
ncbi:Planctomycete cytochrome C [Aquisphaera giovannonii]|uniref:Planctomycete cytochrome C n=1 Tax=Aquisphaera giovannonii TaxID=406548 RepID=A0A5B9W3N8_9BACT|nr:PSD1 and planctomycete cytochrome C domain-containing protein [Aquisphaera giovannonii]QEH34570.1 Planctomycete cytochrome C [Aquisphaera giovannonii]